MSNWIGDVDGGRLLALCVLLPVPTQASDAAQVGSSEARDDAIVERGVEFLELHDGVGDHSLVHTIMCVYLNMIVSSPQEQVRL